MNTKADQLPIVRLSLISCDRNGASVLTNLAPNLRTRTLPTLSMEFADFVDLKAAIRKKLGKKLAKHLTRIEQIETVFEDQKLVCDVLGLVINRHCFRPPNSDWWPLFNLFPWEDWRKCAPLFVTKTLLPQLQLWAKRFAEHPETAKINICRLFADKGHIWQSCNLVQRYDILYQAGLLPEALRDRSGASVSVLHRHVSVFGQTMKGRDRRQLGLAISHLRQLLQIRPILADLLTSPFSLGDLQKSTEALSGLGLHTQNFRRDILRTGLIEESSQGPSISGTRLAKQYQWVADLDMATSVIGMPLPRKKC